MFNRFLSQFTLALLVAMPLMAEPISQEENVYFKMANLDTLPLRSKGCRCHPVRVQKHHRKRCCRKGPTGATGATGPAGATGATGATGIGPSLDYASFVTTFDGPLIPGEPIPFDSTSINDNSPDAQNGTTITPGVTLSPDTTTFTIQVPGDYLINVGVNAVRMGVNAVKISSGTTSTTDHVNFVNTAAFVIFKNGSPINLGIFGGSSFSGTSLMLAGLQIGDTISVQAATSTSQVTPPVLGIGAQSGYINFLRMGP